MFTDGRSKKIVFVAQCILNQNAISDGTADFPGANVELVRALLEAEVGIVQMPCPELCCLGLDRGNPHGADSPVLVENTRIRRAMGGRSAGEELKALVSGVAEQALQYRRHGFDLRCIIGSNRSPCCGVDTTSDHDREEAGQGVFISALIRALDNAGISVPVMGVKAGPAYVEKVKKYL